MGPLLSGGWVNIWWPIRWDLINDNEESLEDGQNMVIFKAALGIWTPLSLHSPYFFILVLSANDSFSNPLSKHMRPITVTLPLTCLGGNPVQR